MRLLLSVLVLAGSAAFSAHASTTLHATVYLTDGESVDGCVLWHGRAGVLILLDCNPHPYFPRDHEVFIEADRICRVDEYTCGSCKKLADSSPQGQWAAEARKADAEIRKAETARLAAKKDSEPKTVAESETCGRREGL
jgi:hypothetical protein